MQARRFAIFAAIGLFANWAVLEIYLPAPISHLPVVTYQGQELSIQNASINASTTAHTSVDLIDTTWRWQVRAYHQQTSSTLSSITETLGSGVCAFDVNNDSWIDLFFIGGSGHTRTFGKKSWWQQANSNTLLINQRGRYFIDQTTEYGLEGNYFGMGCAASDLDLDGWNDLVVVGADSSNAIFRNIGGSHFENVTNQSQIEQEKWSSTASIGDFNNDSLPDIYISNYIRFKKGAKTFERNKGFVTTPVGFDPTLYDAEPNKLYINRGNFKFTESAESLGVSNKLGRSLGAKWVDLNQDQWLDLIVINDVGSPNQVFINSQAKEFNSDKQSIFWEVTASHDLAPFNYSSREKFDALITRSMNNPTTLLVFDPISQNYIDASWQSGFAQPAILNKGLWGIAEGDLNNDGIEDFYVAAGTVVPDSDSPYAPQGQDNLLAIGRQDGFSISVAKDRHQWPMSSRGAITADINNDGTLELIVSNNNDYLQIFENQSTVGNWLGIDLTSDNTGAYLVGTQVQLTINEEVINKTYYPNPGFMSQPDYRMHIGLGQAKTIDKMVIKWPNGKIFARENLDINHYYRVSQSKSTIYKVIPEKSATQTPLNYLLNKETIDNADLTQLLIRLNEDEAAYLVSTIWDSFNTATKLQLLHILKRNWHPRFLTLIQTSLTETSAPKLQIAALDILKSLELEASVRWLLPLLVSSSTEIQCEVAGIFEYYFREEEAVTHRKWLAISPLIKLLSNSTNASSCAANALAESEKPRAVLPLIALVKSNAANEIKATSIRALGLIRDTRAEALLSSIVIDANHQDPKLVAKSLIALKRLNNKDTNELLDATVSIDTDNPQIPLAILAELLSDNESIVFDSQALSESSQKLLDSVSPSALVDETLKYALSIIRDRRLPEFERYLETALHRDNPELQILALVCYTELGLILGDQMQAKIATLNNDQLVGLLNLLKPNTLSLSDNTIRHVAQALLTHAESNNAREMGPLHAFSQQTRKQVGSTMIEILNDRKSELTTPECEALKKTNVSIFELPSTFAIDNENSLLLAGCLLGNEPITTANAKQSIKYRALIKLAIDSKYLSEEQELFLILRSASTDVLLAETQLAPRFKELPQEIQIRAVEVFAKYPDSDNLQTLLWSIAKDTGNPHPLRIAALSALSEKSPELVWQYLSEDYGYAD